MKLSQEKKLLLLVLAFAALAALIVILVILPTVSYIKKINADTANLRQYLEKRYATIHNLRAGKEQMSDIKEQTASFVQYLFHGGEELKLITALENIADQADVEQAIQNYDTRAGRAHFALSVSGSYYQVLNYLRQIENMNYFASVDAARLSAIPNPRAANDVNLDLQLSLYVTP